MHLRWLFSALQVKQVKSCFAFTEKKKTSEREEGTEREGSRKGLMHTITNDVNVSKDRNVKSSSTDMQADSLNVHEMLGTLPHR